jgi:hypothetical protein
VLVAHALACAATGFFTGHKLKHVLQAELFLLNPASFSIFAAPKPTW